MEEKFIKVVGAKEHNLKNVSIEILAVDNSVTAYLGTCYIDYFDEFSVRNKEVKLDIMKLMPT